jgi:ABC-type branched-subunit amino acid transport system substrate-binding protein
MNTRSPLAFAAMALALASALAIEPALAKKKSSPDVVEDALAFVQTDRARSVSILEQAIRQNPNSKDVGLLMVHAGEQRRIAGQIPEAHGWFSKAAAIRDEWEPAALLGIILIEAGDGLDGKVLAVLRDAPEKDVLATQNADRYLLLAVDAGKQGDAKNVTAYTRKALAWSRDDPEVQSRVQETAQALAAAPPDSGGGTVVANPIASGTPLDRAEKAYAAGDLESARRDAEKALKGAEGDVLRLAEGLIQVIDSGPADRNRIAVLLPLSGKYEMVGQQVRDALTFGYGNAGRQLEFVDSGGTPETAVQALEGAVLNRHAIAVVGPLLTDETDAVISRAEELHVPLVSLSQSYEDTSNHHWSLQGMYTRADQVDALLQYAMGELKMESFAMFAPDSSFGSHAQELFRKGVEARGGRIAADAVYPAAELPPMEAASTFAEREGDIHALRQRAKENGGNPATVVVPPKLDFQGIFIPDNANNTPLVCSALAYQEFPMGEFQPTRTSPKIPLLGLSTWNTKGLVARGNEYTRDSIFTDVYSADIRGEEDPFVLAYRDQTGKTPTALEATTVDVGKLVAAAARSSASTRPEFREALIEANVPDAITGATGFDPQTLRANRTMLILTITRTDLQQVGSVQLQ